jgi:hypothetical protein
MPAELTRVPMEIEVAWVGKTVTTDPPRLTPHEEWSLRAELTARVPIRVAALMYLPTEVEWGLRPEHASDHAEIWLSFFSEAWSTSDRVQINFAWRRITVTDPDLKADPRPFANVVVPRSATTGEVVPICVISKHAITVAVFALAEQDTERRRMDRWRVRRRLADSLPGELIGLASGDQSGRTPREADGRGTGAL